MMDRDEIVRRAEAFAYSYISEELSPRKAHLACMADFLIEQSQSHGWLDMQMVFLAEAMERDCDEKLAKIKADKGETDTWVLVEERLPASMFNDYLITLKNGSIFQATYSGFTNRWMVAGVGVIEDANHVTAWRQLPEPYYRPEPNAK